MRIYLDTSALIKALVEEVESDALAEELTRRADDDLVSSWLLHTEMHCGVARRAPAIDRSTVDEVLDRVDLVDVERADLLAAAARPGRLRAADAIHLVTALRIEAELMLVYDAELSAAAEAAGLTVLAPA